MDNPIFTSLHEVLGTWLSTLITTSEGGVLATWLSALATTGAIVAAVWIARKQIEIAKRQVEISKEQTSISNTQTDIQMRLLKIEEGRDQAAASANLSARVFRDGSDGNDRILEILNAGGESAIALEITVNGQPASSHHLFKPGVPLPQSLGPKSSFVLPLCTPVIWTMIELELKWRSWSKRDEINMWRSAVPVFPADNQNASQEKLPSPETA